jgi:hypothetical protein
MSDVPASKSIPPKSNAGSPSSKGQLPIVGPAHIPARVRIDGDAMHDPRAPALADDMTRLLRSFLERPASLGHEEVREHERHASAKHDDLQIRLQTVDLEPTAQRHLIEQIKMLISKRFAKE